MSVMRAGARILLIDASDSGRTVLAERLRLQGFTVIESADGAEGAVLALEDPPAAVVADLSMPSISGVQLCRLLGSEPGTSKVPVILRGEDGRRNHFWAEQAGAAAYVTKGRMGELVRALRKAIEARGEPEDFFVMSSTQGLDVRERIATHLDAALFDSVIAAEVRRLGTSESFDRLADLLSQFVSQVTTYRWIAVMRRSPLRLAVHTNAAAREQAVKEALATLELPEGTPVVLIEDDDAVAEADGPQAMQEPVYFGEQAIGTFALAPRASEHRNDRLLVATVLNRRAFLDSTNREVARAKRYNDKLSVVLLDVDHFKHINDRRGHAAGDVVLSAVGKLLGGTVRNCDIVARWGGEEFVIVLPSTPLEGAELVAERIREQLEAAKIHDGSEELIPVTASFGVATYAGSETLEQVIDRADRAMYLAKSGGRNRVVTDSVSRPEPVSAAE
jgi:diguanylate cyclase (GGDEF)-like protein